jgi:DNA processing protein
VASRLDLVALSLFWTEGAGRKPVRRTAAPDPQEPDIAGPDPRTLVDLDEVLAALQVLDAAARAAGLRRRAETAMTAASARGIGVVTRADPAYPARLEEIHDPPPAIWTRGALDSCTYAVAVVGSRTATPHGLEVAFRLGRELAAGGFVVVSGLARGVDAAAHAGALRGGGRTVAVLGSGVDVVYPPEHADLAAAVAEGGGLASEFAPGTPPSGWHFPRRNRIISGLSLGVVVVEASHHSGSLITARCAAEQGRSVMAVPGAVLSGRNRGAHHLIKDGAGCVEGAKDVIEQLEADWHAVFHPDPPAQPDGVADAPAETVLKDPILRAMQPAEAYGLEDLAALTGLEGVELMARLARLEVGGWVERHQGGRFVKPGRTC